MKCLRIITASAMPTVFAVAALVLAIASPVPAGYWNPPGWETNPHFTHQIWEFGSSARPVGPDIVSNPFGDPLLGVHGANIGWSPSKLDRQGVWTIEQGWAQIEGIIPNEEDPDLLKEIWIQATVHTSIQRGQIFDIRFEYPAGTYAATLKDYSTYAAGDGWTYFTYLFEITPQPDWEVVGLNMSVPTGEYIAVDQLAIDTRCIPEPATVLLLGLGGIALLRRRR